MIGTDFVKISSTDNIFTQGASEHSWDPSVGVMIVVGVVAYSDDVNYSLTVSGPQVASFNFTDVVTNNAHIYDLPLNKSRTSETYIYRWFNWAALDFTLSVT